LTGGTGFLGSHIAVALLRRGYRLILLARPYKQEGAAQRIDRLFRWLGMDSPQMARSQTIEAYLEKPGFGLDPGLYRSIVRQTDEIIHCASNTSFSERKRKEIETVNLETLRHVLDFAAESRCAFFHHLSTAYVAGQRQGPCREAFVETHNFTNVYEETKYRGERMIFDLCRSQGIRLNIYRPSIVYGDSKTGRTLRFNALYYPIRTVLFFKNLFEKDITEKGGKRAGQMGVRINERGVIHLPIRIEAEERGGINLIPIDYLVTAFLEIRETCLEGGIFHVVNNRLVNLGELADYTSRFFQVEGIEIVSPGGYGETLKNGLEFLFEQYVAAYRPYMIDNRQFENERAKAILIPKRIECPDFDFDLFSTCMRYGLDSEWGARHP
jgi:nucleoside-diphosphate-sugar epimerase